MKTKSPKLSAGRFVFYAPRFARRGFTIVEMLVAAFIFSIIMVGAVGSTLSIVKANQQAEAVKSVVSNFSFALESMVRNIRIGSNYDCGAVGAPLNCTVWTGGAPAGSTSMTFTDHNGILSGYRLNGTVIQKMVDPTATPPAYIDITSADAVVDRLTFYVDGRGLDDKQPTVVIVVTGHVDFGSNKTSFAIETMATQRKVDSAETI